MGGKIIAKEYAESDHPVTLIATVPFGNGKSFYAKWGDWIVVICTVLLIFGLVIGNNKYNKRY